MVAGYPARPRSNARRVVVTVVLVVAGRIVVGHQIPLRVVVVVHPRLTGHPPVVQPTRQGQVRDVGLPVAGPSGDGRLLIRSNGILELSSIRRQLRQM
jgi:hypothetical protein